MIHDVCRDWRSWSTAERVLATLIITLLVLATPATILARVL
jgi:hypothetical protein